ncbi:MAG TPA: trypsin-like peptidase domain-containing protein [Candidatus Onthocola stercorigallinarum]|jgi:serine protease Do|nr:trypsin-like peptidase domain-containing protein [Candidatus Onthocola stercorigallinarum]
MEENLNNVEPVNNEHNNKNNWSKKIISYIVVFFVGCIIMYAIIYFFPVTLTESVTREERNVTINDTGIAEAVAKVYDAVVVVSTYSDDTYVASGTGFVYRHDGDTYYLLTNYHVIEDGNHVTVTFTDGSIVETEIIGFDEYQDIAVLAIESNEEYTVAEIGNNDETRIGDTTFAVGAPLDSAYSWTVTRGIISGKDRMVEVEIDNGNYIMRTLQTDAAINSGNSGGPLCNANGEVIGITSLKLVNDGIEGMGFAIPIEDAIDKAEDIINGEVTDYPYLGVSMLDFADAYFSQYYSLIRQSNLDGGVIVTDVVEDSPAANGGIRANDIITAMDGEEVPSVAYLRYYLYQHNVGDTVTFTVYRNGDTRDIEVTLGTNRQTT